MCFQSCDHLFRCLMSSVINKCMALISLCVAGAQELVWRWRDGGPVPAWRLLEMLIRAWGGGLWADALTLCWSRLLSSKSIKLLLTELSLASRGAYCISDSGQDQGKTLIFPPPPPALLDLIWNYSQKRRWTSVKDFFFNRSRYEMCNHSIL